MEHIVQNHVSGIFYISNEDPEIVEEICDECGDNDCILLSYEIGHRFEALENFFNNIKERKEDIITCYIDGATKDEIIAFLIYNYQCDKEIIKNLLEDNIITEEEKSKLLKQVSYSKRKQFRLLNSINFEEINTTSNKTLIKKCVRN